MKSIRRSVFETNSSSTHSLSIEYIYDYDDALLAHNLPRIPKGQEPKVINIQKVNLIQNGIAYGEVDKLRIVFALITELIYDEFKTQLRVDWETKNPTLKHNWNEWYKYWEKKSKQKGTIKYFIEHRYWGYLNAVLRKNCNLKVDVLPIFNYIPYVSDFVDSDLGCESSSYYKDIGLYSDMKRDSFKRVIENIVFNPEISIEQETYRGQ